MVDITNFALVYGLDPTLTGFLFALAGLLNGLLVSYLLFVKSLQY